MAEAQVVLPFGSKDGDKTLAISRELETFTDDSTKCAEEKVATEEALEVRAEELLEASTEKALEVTAEKELEIPSEKALEVTAENPLEVTAEKMLEVTAEKRLEGTAEKTLEFTAEKMLEVAAEKTLELTAENFLEVTAEKTLELTAEKLLEVNTDKTIEVTTEKSLEVKKEIVQSLVKDKINILLRATGNAPIMKKKKWAVESDKTVGSITEFIKKYLKLDASESLFLYVNQSFAPSPDQIIITLFECFGSDGQLVLYYCKSPAWG